MACSNDQEIYLSIDNALEFPIEEIETLYPTIVEYGIKRLILGDVICLKYVKQRIEFIFT